MTQNHLTLIVVITLIFFVIINVDGEKERFEIDENGVLLLNTSNFPKAIKKFKTLIVLLYIKEDSETQKIVDLIAKVGNKFQNATKGIVLAQLSVNHSNSIFGQYDLDGSFGLLAFMDYGKRYVEYTKKLNDFDLIMDFVQKKLADPITQISDKTKLLSIIENRPCVSIGFFSNFTNAIYEDYKISADWFYECDHLVTTDVELHKYFKVENNIPTVKFFKNCVHEVIDFPKKWKFDSNNILKFFVACIEPDVSEFGIDWLMKKVIKEPRFTLILFVKANDTQKSFFIDIMKIYSRRYKEEINMVYIETDRHEDTESFIYTFDIKENNIPCLRAIETSKRYGNNTLKYKPKNETLDDMTIDQFIGEVYYRQLQPYLISDPLPKDWNKEPIITIVGDNFRNITNDPETTTLIIFYNYEQEYESFVKDQLRQLADDLKANGRTDIIIGKSNYYSNEYYGWHPNRFPSIILFPKGVDRFGIEFKMELTLENIKLFLHSDGEINKKEKSKSNQNEEADDKNSNKETENNENVEFEDSDLNQNFNSTMKNEL